MNDLIKKYINQFNILKGTDETIPFNDGLNLWMEIIELFIELLLNYYELFMDWIIWK